MRRRVFLTHLLALAGLPVGLMACSPNKPLVVGIHPWIGYEPLFLAREFGWLPHQVTLREGQSARDSLGALQAGRIDAAALTLDEMLRARAAGLPLTAALVFDVSAGADVVLARPQIGRPADLAGKRLGYEQNALGSLVLAKLLETAGIDAASVVLLDCPPEKQVAAWQAGQLDAAISYPPVAAQLRRLGAVPLFDSRQMPDTIFDVLAVRLDRDPGRLLEALLTAHFHALGYLRSNREDAIYRIARHEAIHPDEVQQVLSGVSLASLNANLHYLAEGGPVTQAAHNLSALMARRGLLPHGDRLENLVSAAWLPHGEDPA